MSKLALFLSQFIGNGHPGRSMKLLCPSKSCIQEHLSLERMQRSTYAEHLDLRQTFNLAPKLFSILDRKQFQGAIPKPLRVLAALLVACDPRAGWHTAGAGHGSALKTPCRGGGAASPCLLPWIDSPQVGLQRSTLGGGSAALQRLRPYIFSSVSTHRRHSSVCAVDGALHSERGLELAGKHVLVTGASGGIGAGIAKELADLGARVIVHYHTRRDGAMNTCAAIKESGRGACDGMVRCDFRSPSAISAMWHQIDQVWNGKIDILVNNAGIVAKVAAEDDAELCAWNECLQVNLHAPMQLSVAAHARMKAQGTGGTIVMITSIHGSSSVEFMTAYACSKAALDRLTAGLSSEWAPDDVRVAAVAPGIVPVERTAAALATPESQALWLPHLPVGRMGSVQDVAKAVAYVCCSPWTSGSVLTLDGGMTARANMPVRPRPQSAAASMEVEEDVVLERID